MQIEDQKEKNQDREQQNVSTASVAVPESVGSFSSFKDRRPSSKFRLENLIAYNKRIAKAEQIGVDSDHKEPAE